MVVVDNVHKSFGTVHAVRGVSFELRPGQITGLLGPNGAGKTTTIRMIAGYLLPDAGRITIAGVDAIRTPAAARRRLGYLPESTPLYPEMKVLEYLRYRARLFGIAREFRRRAIDYVLQRCWLSDMSGRRIATLSKGYKQRVGLAAALLHNPKVLILDEPTNGLDPTQIRETRELIKELAHERTMLLCSHILPEIERLSDRVIVFAGGQVRADGAPADLTRIRGARYVVQTRESRLGENDRILKLWQALPHISDVSSKKPDRAGGGGGSLWTEWNIRAKPGSPDLREQIWSAIQTASLTVRELRAETPTLETIFMELMEDVERGSETPESAEKRESPPGGPAPVIKREEAAA